jgi:tetratricopeptide (TPR) repeat protein
MSTESYLLGLEAYQNKEYVRAIELLNEADADQWDAQLYLGMSYYMVGRHEDARTHFAHMRDRCPEPSLREKAETAFTVVNSKIRQTAKLKQEEQQEEDELTVEW